MIPALFAAWVDAFAVASAALVWMQIAHVTGALWLVPFRRILELLASALVLLAVLVVPIAMAGPPVAHPIRAGVSLLVLVAVAEVLRARSLRQDAALAPRAAEIDESQRRLAAVALPPVAFAITFVAFDLVMRVDEGFRSTIHGLYVFAGGSVAALAFAAVIRFLSRRGVTPGAFFALAKMLVALVIFWAYAGVSQLILVWIADLPEEAPFYAARIAGPWGAVSAALAAFGFAVPLAVLLSWRFKRSPARVAALGAWLLVVRRVDAIWLVVPPARPFGPFPALADVAATLILGVPLVLFVALRARRHATLPERDPRLLEALAWEDA